VASYDPFEPGPYPVAERTFHARDGSRDQTFPCEVWYPDVAGGGPRPLVLFSHHGGGHRRRSSFLCSHLAGHGYVVAALDHAETLMPRFAPQPHESDEQRTARAVASVSERLPDLLFLLGEMLDDQVDPERIGAVGHSFGGWTVLSAAGVEPRIRAVVALAPAGSHRPLPGVIPVPVDLSWARDVPTLYLAAEYDVPVPPDRVRDLFERTPSTKRMFVLADTDHMHFADDVEREHEGIRTATFPGPAAWMPAAMRPIGDLLPGELAHVAVRGLTLSHLDAMLHDDAEAHRFLAGDVEAALAERGVVVTRA
jgi:predicted dienelactone hydrolase